MSVDTGGVKRGAEEPNTNDEMMNRARRGYSMTYGVSMLDRAKKPMIQQQLMMHGIPFEDNDANHNWL